MTEQAISNEEVARELHEWLRPLDAVPIGEPLADEQSIGTLRRRSRRRLDDIGVLTLIDVDGVLVWEDGAVAPALSGFRGSKFGRSIFDGQVVTQIKYPKQLGSNEISDKLRQLDEKLTPNGPARLIEYDKETWQEKPGEATPAPKGRILLFVHGTFSNCARIMAELEAPDEEGKGSPGRDFLAKAAEHYDQVLGYDHFTLSHTPVINAIYLARRFAESKAELDIVCHSRGGLVVRWLCEQLDRVPGRRCRVVFVGCPFQGTSLADPQSLRRGLTLLTNVGKLLGTGVSLVPLLGAAGGLMQILSSAGAFVAKTAATDAMIGLVPGLAAMSRVTNNPELQLLNAAPPQPDNDYFAVVSDFRAETAGWKFWKKFNRLNLADQAADYLVFEQENDLVVDTQSMTFHVFGDKPEVQTNMELFHYFGEDDSVHHVGYFRQPATVDFISRVFGLT